MRFFGILIITGIFFLLGSSFVNNQKDIHLYEKSLFSSDKNNNFCLIVIPKNGSSTVRKILNTLNAQFVPKNDYLSGKYKQILTVRDPLYRSISIYNEVLKLRTKSTGSKTLNSNFYKNRSDPILSFTQFLDQIDDNFYEEHITHQHMALEGKGLTLEDMDFIILFENLNQDLELLCKYYDLPYREFRENVTQESRKRTLVNFINSNEEIRRKIYKIWRKDFDFYEDAKQVREQILKIKEEAL